MYLTRLEIENFKGIQSRQTIDIRPITMLFGPNSAGKSTVLHALHYLREILERGNIDPDLTISGGQIDLGGFSTLVHRRKLDQTISIKVTIDLSDEIHKFIFSSIQKYFPLNFDFTGNELEFIGLPVRYIFGDRQTSSGDTLIKEIAVEVNIEWSDEYEAPIVVSLEVELNGESVASIVSRPPPEICVEITNFNFAHPLLQPAEHYLEDIEYSSNFSSQNFVSPLRNELVIFTHGVTDEVSDFAPNSNLRIAVRTGRNWTLPDLDRELHLKDAAIGREAISEVMEGLNIGSEEYFARVNGLHSLLSELILSPIRLTRDYLTQMTYIGPLREVPTRNFQPQITPDESRWATGISAWDELYRSGGLVHEVNEWISDENRLDTKCKFERTEFKKIVVSSELDQLLESGIDSANLVEMQDLYFNLATHTELKVRDLQTDLLLAPSDVGIGISQMIPIVVGAIRESGGILAIEQPELHVHPRIQVGMGDLFIFAMQNNADSLIYPGKTLIMETHSEHIILRLLRRIRETKENELPSYLEAFSEENLSVIFVEMEDSGVKFRQLRVDDDGDFIDQWPQGFFEERIEELF